jgi:hypothetical protein
MVSFAAQRAAARYAGKHHAFRFAGGNGEHILTVNARLTPETRT